MNAMVTHLSFNQMWPAMILMGITNGMVNPLLNSAGLEGVALKETGLTSGLINVFRQIGTTLGVVGLGLVQSNRYESYLDTHMTDIAAMPASVAKTLTKVLVDAGPFAGHGIAFSTRMSHAPFATDLQTVVLSAYSVAMRNITLVAAVVLVIAGIAALTLMHGQQHSVDIKQ